MTAFSMTPTQLRFPVLTWTAQGNVVDPATLIGPLAPVFTSSNPAVVAWEMRKADGSMGDAGDPGSMAAVGQGAEGTASVAVRVTNADASFFEQTADFTLAVIVPPVPNVDGGSLDFAAAIEKPVVASSRRRS